MKKILPLTLLAMTTSAFSFTISEELGKVLDGYYSTPPKAAIFFHDGFEKKQLGSEFVKIIPTFEEAHIGATIAKIHLDTPKQIDCYSINDESHFILWSNENNLDNAKLKEDGWKPFDCAVPINPDSYSIISPQKYFDKAHSYFKRTQTYPHVNRYLMMVPTSDPSVIDIKVIENLPSINNKEVGSLDEITFDTRFYYDIARPGKERPFILTQGSEEVDLPYVPHDSPVEQVYLGDSGRVDGSGWVGGYPVKRGILLSHDKNTGMMSVGRLSATLLDKTIDPTTVSFRLKNNQDTFKIIDNSFLCAKDYGDFTLEVDIENNGNIISTAIFPLTTYTLFELKPKLLGKDKDKFQLGPMTVNTTPQDPCELAFASGGTGTTGTGTTGTGTTGTGTAGTGTTGTGTTGTGTTGTGTTGTGTTGTGTTGTGADGTNTASGLSNDGSQFNGGAQTFESAYESTNKNAKIAIIDLSPMSLNWLNKFYGFLIKHNIPVMIIDGTKEDAEKLSSQYEGLKPGPAPAGEENLQVFFDYYGINHYPAIMMDGWVWQHWKDRVE